MSQELVYLALIFALLVVPRALQRFRIPAPLTCLLFGIGVMLALGDGAHDPVVALLATLVHALRRRDADGVPQPAGSQQKQVRQDQENQ